MPTRNLESHVVRLSSEKRPAVRLVVAVTMLACLLVIGFSAWLIWSFRQTQISNATVATTNVARMVAVQVESAMKTASVVLTNLTERVQRDGTSAEALKRLRSHLVATVHTAPELHGLFVYGTEGEWLATSLARPMNGNNSDREYFKFHRDTPGQTVHVGHPIKSRSTGVWIIPVSMRINNADGAFAGVALVTMKVDFFEQIYERLDVGRTGTVLLALSNGTVIYRRPFDEKVIGTDLSHGSVFQELKNKSMGSAFLLAKVDNIVRLYAYRRVPSFPFVVAVGQTKDELLRPWSIATGYIISAAFLICAIFSLFAYRLIKQIIIRDVLDTKLRSFSETLREHNTGLKQLAHTDKLTEIANRRRFDEVIELEFKRSSLGGGPVSLILIDVDFFKQFNDVYGHIAGDACLQSIARVLRDVASRSGDVPARYGGEEFAVILPGTDQAGAVGVAERIRSGVLALQIPHRSSPHTYVSASLGVTTIGRELSLSFDLISFIDRADKNLYKAKEGGRNAVCGDDATHIVQRI